MVRTLQGAVLKGGRMGVLANLCKVFRKGKARRIMRHAHIDEINQHSHT